MDVEVLKVYIQPTGVNFGYSNIIKTLYKQGKLPSVKHGFYGDELTKANVSLEHLRPKSKRGKTELCNLVLATRNNNHRRGVRPLKEVINPEIVEQYLNQFKGVIVDDFNGNKYIEMIQRTLRKLLND